MLTGGLLWIPVPAEAVCTGMAKRLGRGEGVSCIWDLLDRLPKEVDPVAVFPLHMMDANPVRWTLYPPDAPVCGPHQSDGDPTLDVSARPRVGLPPLCCKATG